MPVGMDLLHTNNFSIGSTQEFHLRKSSVTAIKRCSMFTTVYVLTLFLLTRLNWPMSKNTTIVNLFFKVRACPVRRCQVWQRSCLTQVKSQVCPTPRRTQVRFIGKQWSNLLTGNWTQKKSCQACQCALGPLLR